MTTEEAAKNLINSVRSESNTLHENIEWILRLALYESGRDFSPGDMERFCQVHEHLDRIRDIRKATSP